MLSAIALSSAVPVRPLLGAMPALFKLSVYGQLKIWDELNEAGIEVARCTVERLMRKEGIAGCTNGKARRTAMPGPDPIAAEDLVRFVHVAFVIDVYSRMMVGWRVSSSLRSDLALDALEMAVWARGGDADGVSSQRWNGSTGSTIAAARADRRHPADGVRGSLLARAGRQRYGGSQGIESRLNPGRFRCHFWVTPFWVCAGAPDFLDMGLR